MADDKVRSLAAKISEELIDSGGYEVSKPLTFETDVEERIRAELKPLLDIAEAATGVLAEDDRSEILLERLAAELKGWTK